MNAKFQGISFIFPLTLDPAQDVLISTADCGRIHVLAQRLTALAAALSEKRAQMLRAKETVAVCDYPEATLALSAADLAAHEVPGLKGQSFTEAMQQICDRKIPRGQTSLSVQISKLSKLIEEKTQGRFRVSLLKGKIAIVDSTVKIFDLSLGRENYILPIDRCALHIDIGTLRKIAKQGMRGLAVAELDAKLTDNPRSLVTRVSVTNRFFKEQGYASLCLINRKGKIYLLDLGQQKHADFFKTLPNALRSRSCAASPG